MRLIDADELIKEIRENGFRWLINNTDKEECIHLIKRQPTKDCIHWTDMCAGCTEHVKLCTVGGYMVGENGYCVYGERKE